MAFNLSKFYPIGTICQVKGQSDFVMIIGYKQNAYESVINTYDYEGCPYPYGTLSNKKILFNGDEIKKIVFEGYSEPNKTDLKEEKKVKVKSKFIYDDEKENEKIYVDDDIFFVKNNSYNQLIFDKSGKVLIAEYNEKDD